MTGVVRHLAHLDLAQNELRGLRLENLGVDPASPAAGRLFFHSGRGRLRYYAGAWHEAQRYYSGLDQLGGLSPALGVLAAGSGAAWVALAPGADGQALVADSGEASGLRWIDLPVADGVFVDDEFRLHSAADPAATLAFDCGELTAARTWTVPDADGTVALRSDLIGYVTEVSADLPLSSSGGPTPTLTLGIAGDGGVDAEAFPLRLRLSATSGLRTTVAGLALRPAPAGGLATDSSGAKVELRADGGLTVDANGLAVNLGSGLSVDGLGAVIVASGALSLNDLRDVALASPAEGETLVYDGSRWVNGAAVGGGGVDIDSVFAAIDFGF